MRADVHRFALPDPGDVSALAEAIEKGVIDPPAIVAVIGKTHGNGLVNDYTRGYLALSLAALIAAKTGESPAAVRERIPFVFSGGVEGVLAPHYAVFSVSDSFDERDGNEEALAIGVAFTPDFHAHDVGRARQIALTEEAVKVAMDNAGIVDADAVHFVQIKGPAFSLADIEASHNAGQRVVVNEPMKLMGFGRAASALAVARALGEISSDLAIEDVLLEQRDRYSSVASCSAGSEVRRNEVIVMGMSTTWSGPLRIVHAPLNDPLDTSGYFAALCALDIDDTPQVSESNAKRLRAAFVKCEAPRNGLVRGRMHTMLNDGDIDQQRHIRAAVGAIAASVLNETEIFVSGGAEHQGPDTGGLVALIAEAV